MATEAYLHAIDPFVFQLSTLLGPTWEGIGVRWYGLAYAAGFIAGYYIILSLCRRGRLLLQAEQVGDFVFWVALGTIIGGRLGYCLFYNPELFLRFRPTVPFWGVLAVNEGGMASHGGIIGIVVACYLFARNRRVPTAHLCDLTTLGGTAGVFFGRIANFINGELVGRPAPENFPLAVKFPQDIYLWPVQEPARLLGLRDVVTHFGISPETWTWYVSGAEKIADAGQRIDGTLARIIVEVQNGNGAVAESLRPLLTPRHPSQIYEALLEGLLMFVILNLIWLKPRKPGVITGAFLSLYSIVRFIGEQFRMPDAAIGFQAFGLTRGQILSMVLFIFGVSVFLISSRLDRKAVGGWFAAKDDN